VLIHDHHAIINFKQHDVAVPITVLEELDKFKLGNDTKNFSAREVIRFIDKLVGNERLSNWIDIESDLGKFKIIMDHDPKMINAETVYASSKTIIK
jgi:PhoH-like ATPase